ncbi:MAG: hypothetical protein R2822_28730 [Spirosomataceae bacterium]
MAVLRPREVQQVLESMNLTEEIAKLTDGLNTPIISEGERFSLVFVTKIALARCLLIKPKLLLYTDALREIEAKRTYALLIYSPPPPKHGH